jgi:hypothetical protein
MFLLKIFSETGLTIIKHLAILSNVLAHFGPLVKWFKTPPFHGGNTGSNPVGVTIFDIRISKVCNLMLGWIISGLKTEHRILYDIGTRMVQKKSGRLAQLGERLPYKQDVGSSILSSPTISMISEVRSPNPKRQWVVVWILRLFGVRSTV